MTLSLEAIQYILGIRGYVPLTAKEMARSLTVTFFPFSQASKRVSHFTHRLKISMEKLGVKILPYDEALMTVRMRKKIRKGIVVVVAGECNEGNFPVDNVMTFIDNPIVSIIESPQEVKEGLSYERHMEIAQNLFTWHMSNIVICVSENNWIIYSFNGLSPFYKIDCNFDRLVLEGFISKIATRVSPPLLKEFKITKVKYDFIDNIHARDCITDLIESGPLLANTGLFPPLKRVREFKYRSNFYRQAASFHLDERQGISYGFIARQVPLKLTKLVPFKKIKNTFNFKNNDFTVKGKKSYVLLKIKKDYFVLEVPPVWAFTSRSGSEKTNLNPHKDIIKIGLINGELFLEIPPSIEESEDYKPSFDTRVILAHCLANSIYASILREIKKGALFPLILERRGLAVVHWHGNLVPEFIPRGWYIYGEKDPPVLCSSMQSAIYAFRGKGEAVKKSLFSRAEYLGDVHIEPQHGINVIWETVTGLGHYLLSYPFIVNKSKNKFLSHSGNG